jgi:hypothetical protein
VGQPLLLLLGAWACRGAAAAAVEPPQPLLLPLLPWRLPGPAALL